MKKTFIFLIAAAYALSAHSQLPKWVIPPAYDTIAVKVSNRLIQSETSAESSLWSMDGKCLFSTEHQILPFKDGVATIVTKDNNTITGFVDAHGKFIALPDVKIAYGNPYFENGMLICREQANFAYYKKDGSKAVFPESVKSYPFHGGYAPYFTYAQLEKSKDPHYGYYKANGQTLRYRIQENSEPKALDAKEIEFLSGIGSNGKGVAVIKNKLYWFNTETEIFEPMLWGNEESEKKRHLNLAADHGRYFLNLPSDSILIQAKYGKNQMARLCFDNELRPTVFTFEDETVTFKPEAEKAIEMTSDLQPFESDNLYGISMGTNKVLPAQFERIGLMYGHNAFVKKNGKWGILEILPDQNFNLRINKGEDIAFRHQKFETQIRLDLPAQISAKEVRIDIPEQTGCLIDKTSRGSKDTESGNFVTYNCTLIIPESLPDTITNITYSPIKISYDGISLFDRPVTMRAWHLKYYNVDLIESETSISDGVASFTININAQRNVGESDYPFDVRIELDTDSALVDYEKISETRYKCTIANLQDGEYDMNIYVTEKGCPSSVFPFEILYTKPIPKKRQKESFSIRKKRQTLAQSATE